MLPPELLVEIFNYLSIETLRVIEETCARWSLVITQTFYKKFLSYQHCSIRKHLEDVGNIDSFSPDITKTLFLKVYNELPENWRQGRFTKKSYLRATQFKAGEDGVISSIVVYKDKLYFGKNGPNVEVRDARDLSLIAEINSDLPPGPVESTRPCKLCQHGTTLAVLGPNRHRIRLFDTRTDRMVSEIETGVTLGPVYNIAITDKLLVVLSGWMLYYWKLEMKSTRKIEGHYQGCIPDFERDGSAQNWLEAHDVAVNSSWVVTRATRMRLADGQMGMTHFLHVRKVDPSGYVGSLLRPESSQLPGTVYETTCMSLSKGDLLAIGYRVNDEGVMSVLDLNTGHEVYNIQSPHFLSSVQIPLKWCGSCLFLKIIPVDQPQHNQDGDGQEFGVSVGLLNMNEKTLTVIPGIVYDNSEDLLHIDDSQIIRVSHKMDRLSPSSGNQPIDLNMDLETYASLETENEDHSPVFSVDIFQYDFWNLPS